jgi:hypothetical protein
METPATRIPDEWRRKYMQRPLEKLPGDVVKLFDEQFALNIRLRKERDEMNRKLLNAQSRLRFARGWIWVLTLAMAGSWALIFGMVKLWLEPILEKVPR